MAEPNRYLVALGSNMRAAKHGAPRRVIAAAGEAMRNAGMTLLRISEIVTTSPVGPSRRRYANAAALVETELAPLQMLSKLHDIESEFGRRRVGQDWRARPLDLDIALWSGGIWASDTLVIPHPLLRSRSFVLAPAMQIAPDWRDPLTGLTIRHLHARLTRPRPATR